MAEPYEAFAYCHDCEWQHVGPLNQQRRLSGQAEKHTQQESHVTSAGIREAKHREAPRP